jgi:Tol biopolymer transport system component
VLPPASPGRRDEPAELWILDITTSKRVRLARDADLLVAPQFDVDGGYLAYRSTGPHGEQRLVRVDLESRARRVMYEQSGGFGVFPIGFSEGALLFARLSTAGTDLYRVRDGEGAEFLLHASDHVARDWRLSPDGRSLSFLAPELAAERIVHRLHVVSVDAAERMSGLGAGGLVEQFSPVWTPAGDAVTVGREAYPAVTAAAVTLSLDGGSELALAAPERGFDAPLGWSPDGRYLAARSFDGPGSYEPGRESMVVISIDGVRRAVTARTELIFLGWLQSG